jgi:purine-nucleoside phosphorylase
VSLAIVAGSGLSGLASILQVHETIPFEKIPGVGSATVTGHAGQLLRGTVDGCACQLMLGRRHFYEGEHRAIARLIDFVAEAGATSLLVTSAAGGLRRDLCAGDLVVIHDFVDLQNRDSRARGNEYRAHPATARGIRIDAVLTRAFEHAATAACVPWQRGISSCTSGPTYESPMDVEFLQYTGAMVATMSGAPEVTHANRIGLPAAAVAVVTNPCTGIDSSVPDHETVLAASAGATMGLARVLRQFIATL